MAIHLGAVIAGGGKRDGGRGCCCKYHHPDILRQEASTAKVLKTVGVIAGAVALAATGIGIAFEGALLAGVGTFASIGTVAGVVAGVANLGASALAPKAKAAIAQGQVNELIIGANNPQPYVMGRTYTGGVKLADIGYGGLISGVQNPYLFLPVGYSCCGPVEALESVQFDFADVPLSGSAATGYYAGFAYADVQFGTRPEADALAPQWAGTPGWSSSHKLSSWAAIGYSLRWDKEGTRFAGGQLPVIGAIWQGVKVYDPRLDSTYPGGSGSHRIADETTWEWSDNPALHALAYAYGRYVNGVKVFGVDLGAAAIRLDQAAAWANTCEANGWTVNGTIYEPGDKWNNLKRICEAGGAVPVLSGGLLGFDFQAPRTSLYTFTRDDLGPGAVGARLGRRWKDRHNTIVARYRSEDHQWNFVQAGVINELDFVTADGEEKSDERQWDLVTGVDQVTELAIYDLWQRREAGPFTVPFKPHMRAFAPGDCLTGAADVGLHPDGAVKCVVRRRVIDPLSGVVMLELEQETDAKHDAALGTAGSAPSVPALPTSAELDQAPVITALPPSSGGSGSKSASSSTGSANSTTRTIISTGLMTVSLASGESLYGSGDLGFVVLDGNGTRSCTTYWQYSPAGAGTWSDFGAGAAASVPASTAPGLTDSGAITTDEAKSGLSAGDYDVRLQVALDANGLTVGFYGLANVLAA